jgi:hypothetical protein
MKNLIFIFCILIILFKTGNVFSDNKLFSVNNVEINLETSKNTEELANEAFIKAFKKLTNRLLLEEDFKNISNTKIQQIKKLISYYQITEPKNIEKRKKSFSFNIFFDKDRMHNFFYDRNILYSDIIDTEVILFPLYKKDKQYFVYTQNYFYENWNKITFDNLIQYSLPVESIENIEKINLHKDNIYNLNISDFFKEYDTDNVVFASIESIGDSAQIFLNTRIEGKKINKKITIDSKKNNLINFNDYIIIEINNVIRDLIKSQNLIDVRTPSFLNAKIELTKKNNLVIFNNRLKKIDLIDNFYVQQLNKDYALVKIKYLGKINKIMNKLKEQKINLKLIKGQWQLKII